MLDLDRYGYEAVRLVHDYKNRTDTARLSKLLAYMFTLPHPIRLITVNIHSRG